MATAAPLVLGLIGTTVRVGTVAVAISLLWTGLRRAGIARQARTTGIVISGALVAWFATMEAVTWSGFFATRVELALPLCWGIAFLWIVPLLRSQTIGAVLDAIPPWWLIALQAYRFLGGLNWFAQLAAGRLPADFAVAAGITDALVGLLAVIVAIWVYRGARGWRTAAIAWNVLGLFDFAAGMDRAVMGVLSGEGFVGLFLPYALPYPVVMIPAFMAPISTDFHILSLRQLARALKRDLQSRPAPARWGEPALASRSTAVTVS
jgi:hypothetical protein